MSNVWSTLRHCNLHLHTNFSDGSGSPEQLLLACAAAGLQRIAVTDHSEYGHPHDMTQRWVEYVHELQRLRQDERFRHMEVLIGLETGMSSDGRPKVPQEIIAEADVIIASVHKVNLNAGEDVSNLPPANYWERYRQQIMLAASCPQVDIIGHMEGYLVADWKQLGGSTFADRRRIEKGLAATYFPLSWYADLAKAAVANNVAVEIHGLSESPRVEVIGLLRDYGVKFSIGSDAHSLEHVNQLGYVKYVVDELGLDAGDFAECVGLMD